MDNSSYGDPTDINDFNKSNEECKNSLLAINGNNWFEYNEKKYILLIKKILEIQDYQRDLITKNPKCIKVEENISEIFKIWSQNCLQHEYNRIQKKSVNYEYSKVQLISALWLSNIKLDKDRYMKLTIPEIWLRAFKENNKRDRVYRFEENGYVPKNKPLMFKILDFCTGSGKTDIAILSVLYSLCNDVKWSELKESYLDIKQSQQIIPTSGICNDRNDEFRLARLAVFFVPPIIVYQWLDRIKSIVSEAEIFYKKKIKILNGYDEYKKLKNLINDYNDYIFLWVIGLQNIESNKISYESYDDKIDIAFKIVDELGNHDNSFSIVDKKQCTFLQTFILQATISSLEKCLNRKRHYFRDALNLKNDRSSDMSIFSSLEKLPIKIKSKQYDNVSRILCQKINLDLMCMPKVLRQACFNDCVNNMPSGLYVFKIECKFDTLWGKFNGCDMIKKPFVNLLNNFIFGENNELFQTDDQYLKSETNKIWNLMKKELNEKHTLINFKNIPLILNKIISEFEKIKNNKIEQIMLEFNQIPHYKKKIIEEYENFLKSCSRVSNKINEIHSNNMDCPICLEKCNIDDSCIMSCCSGIFHKECINNFNNNKCPLCRSKNLKFNEIKTSLIEEKTYPKINLNEITSWENSIDEINDNKLPMFNCVCEIIRLQIHLKYCSRIILGYNFTDQEIDSFPFKNTIKQLKYEINKDECEIISIDQDNKNILEIKKKYDDTINYFYPIILIINTGKDSKSVSGFDGVITDLVIVTDKMKIEIQQQLAGRCLRRLRNDSNKSYKKFIIIK